MLSNNLKYFNAENNKGKFYLWDNRLHSLNPARRLSCLDRPPYSTGLQRDGDISYKNMYSENKYNLNLVNKRPCNFNVGQVRYYIDRQIAHPHLPINFPTNPHSTVDIYKDPMGTVRPQWNLSHLPKCQYDRIIPGIIGEDFPTTSTKLTFLSDTNLHRQDIMARQQRKFNETRSDVFLNSD